MIPTDPRIHAGMAAQGQLLRETFDRGAQRLGWKAGHVTAAARAKLGTDVALTGFLTDQTLFTSGSTVSIAGWDNPLLEAEVAVRMGTTVDPDASTAQIIAAIDALAPAIELVDVTPGQDVEMILAGNISHRGVLVGAWVPGASLDAARLDVRIVGEDPMLGINPQEALGKLVDVLAAVAGEATLAGEALRAGDVVITGSPIGGIPLAPGKDASVSLNGGTPVSVAIV